MNIHLIHEFKFDNDDNRRLERIEALLQKMEQKGEEFMATVKETLAAIDAKTNDIATDVASVRTDIGEVKTLVQKLKDGQTDPALEAQAQAVLDKLTGAEGDLKSTETDLSAVGKDEPAPTA